MIILTDIEEAFDKIRHPFMLKPSTDWIIEGTYLIKAIYAR